MMASLTDKGNYLEIKGHGVLLRISKNNGTVTDPKAALVKSDITIVVAALDSNGYKELAAKVARKYRGRFD